MSAAHWVKQATRPVVTIAQLLCEPAGLHLKAIALGGVVWSLRPEWILALLALLLATASIMTWSAMAAAGEASGRLICGDDWEEARVSPHAERELRQILECGILAYGFARARCDDCGPDFLIAFSCKGRGVCPSCNTRRMAETAAHLADHVLPRRPVRQWVRSLPKRLRYHLQHDREALNSALRISLDAVERRRRTHSPGAGPKARTGAVAFIHRFGSSLNGHTHFPVCVIDGVFEPDQEHGARFIPVDDLGLLQPGRRTHRQRQEGLRHGGEARGDRTLHPARSTPDLCELAGPGRDADPGSRPLAAARRHPDHSGRLRALDAGPATRDRGNPRTS